MSFIYSVHRLPSDSPDLAFFAGRFSALRLNALAASPDSFSSNFTIESAITPADWIARVSQPQKHIFLCVAHPPDTPAEQQTLNRGEWVGKVTLLGPLSKHSFELPKSGRGDAGPLGAEDDETRWQMTALYTSAAHRGRGLAKMLIAGAVQFASTEGRPEPARVRIFINPTNGLVKRLYESLGFIIAGTVTLKEAFRQNGDASLLPADGGVSDPEKWDTWVGTIMEVLKPGV
ncbi:GNAT family [Phlyctema vagabunda]|uniref:GNAT family n=1 Tax=Phlyctema vagabunda TaxID=108571 RepID=A0ABR4PJ64_9HELO